MRETLFARTAAALRAVFLGATLLACLLQGAAFGAGKERAPLVIEALRCEGNVATSCRFILSHVYLAPGDRLDEEKLQDAKLRLSWLRNFSFVDIRLEKGSARGRVIVVVEVTESSTIVSAFGLGLTTMDDSTSEVFYGRVTDDDLFGAAKILNVDLESRAPSNGLTQTDLFARVQYVDPQLLDSQHYFLDADLSYRYAQYDFTDGDFIDERMWSAGVEVGRRFGAFAYVAAGYEYRPVVDVVCRISSPAQSTVDTTHGSPTVAAGWNADDPVFPSGGLELNARYSRDISGCGNVAADGRYTWAIGHGGYLSLHAQYPLGGGVEYSHDLGWALDPGEIRRARWYVEPGIWSLGYSSDQQLAGGAGVRAGLRLDTKYLGTVDLFIYVTTPWRQHGGSP